MSDLISREALLSEYKKLLTDYYRVPQEKIHHLITNAPAIEQGEPVAWQFYIDGRWHDGMRGNNHKQDAIDAGDPVRELYTAPAQSLQAYDDEVIERVITLLKDSARGDGIIYMRVDDLIEDVRVLKGK